MTSVLQTRGLTLGYAGQPVVHDLDIEVEPGQVVTLLGANGAGKTTTMLGVAGELPPIAGEVLIGGKPSTAPLHRRAADGLSYVTEERSIFKTLSTRDNFRCGGVSPKAAVELFPELERSLGTRAGLLSGGEQQMLTLARALLRRPRLLLADELSLGLAPLIVDRLLRAVRQAADESGTGALVVEQHARKALRYADHVYVLRGGRIEMAVSAEEARRRLPEIEAAYLAAAPAERAAAQVGGSAPPAAADQSTGAVAIDQRARAAGTGAGSVDPGTRNDGERG